MLTSSLKVVLTLTAVAGLAACDSRQENVRENALENKADQLEEKADAVRQRSEAKADALEDRKAMEKPSETNARLEKAADVERRAGETNADALEKKADAVREQK